MAMVRASSSTSGTSGVVYVNAVGGFGNNSTDETTVLQSIIDNNVGKIITFDPQGIYRVQKLLLPSNTHLNLNGATIRRFNNTDGQAANATIRNSDHTNGNSNITVRDGFIDYAASTSGPSFNMVKVSQVRVQNLNISKALGTFTDWIMVFQQGCQYVRIDNCRITGATAVGEDGLHIKSSQDVVVTNCLIESGDDAIVLVHEFNQTLPIKNIAISNCVISSQNAHALRISVWSTETQPIEDVTIDNIVIKAPPGGTGGGETLIIDDQTNTGLLRRVNLSNFVVNSNGYASGCVMSNVVDSKFTNWTIHGSNGVNLTTTNLDRCLFTNVVCDTNIASNPLWTIDGGCTDLTFVGCAVRNSTLWGWVINGTGTRDLVFSGCRASNMSQPAWNIAYAARVSLIGCTFDNANPSTGTAQAGTPINLDTTNPPTGIKVVGCNFVNYTNTAPIFNVPAGQLEYIGNTDAQSRGTQLANTKMGFFGTTPVAKPTITGSKGSNAAVTSLVAQLAALGLITDSTT